ncbi:MAG TPA: heavy metal-associated domain-containing protein [Deinococcales bacterium]|nr:heavy metal-associated domain-containing protein [Deinococcales bacterium]
MRTTILRSSEFTCPSCISRIVGSLSRLPGVERSTVHFSTGRIVINHDADRVSPSTLVEEVRRLGYESRESPY